MAAEPLIFFRVLQELYDFDQLFFRFLDAFNIGEGNAGRFLDINLRLALADLHQAAAGTAHAIGQEVPQYKENYDWQQPRENHRQPITARLSFERNARSFEILGQARVFHSHDNKRQRFLGAFAKLLDALRRKNFFDCLGGYRTADFLVSDHQVGYLTTFDQGLELAIGKAFGRLREDEILRCEHQA